MDGAPPDRIRRSRELLGNPYAYLTEDGGYEALLPGDEVVRRRPTASRIDLAAIRRGKKRGDRFSRAEIEDVARRLQRALWAQQKPVNLLDVLDPTKALESVGFEVVIDRSLGEIEAGGGSFGVAGILDRDNASVRISPRFSDVYQRFTLAHELGHVVLDHPTGLHRDRALDGSMSRRPRSVEDAEANYFAAAFLMPEKLVREEFQRRFGTNDFVLDTPSRFGLFGEGKSDSSRKRLTRSDVARLLARATLFHLAAFTSLAEYFRVSEGAMAVRLEELGLLRG